MCNNFIRHLTHYCVTQTHLLPINVARRYISILSIKLSVSQIKGLEHKNDWTLAKYTPAATGPNARNIATRNSIYICLTTSWKQVQKFCLTKLLCQCCVHFMKTDIVHRILFLALAYQITFVDCSVGSSRIKISIVTLSASKQIQTWILHFSADCSRY